MCLFIYTLTHISSPTPCGGAGNATQGIRLHVCCKHSTIGLGSQPCKTVFFKKLKFLSQHIPWKKMSGSRTKKRSWRDGSALRALTALPQVLGFLHSVQLSFCSVALSWHSCFYVVSLDHWQSMQRQFWICVVGFMSFCLNKLQAFSFLLFLNIFNKYLSIIWVLLNSVFYFAFKFISRVPDRTFLSVFRWLSKFAYLEAFLLQAECRDAACPAPLTFSVLCAALYSLLHTAWQSLCCQLPSTVATRAALLPHTSCWGCPSILLRRLCDVPRPTLTWGNFSRSVVSAMKPFVSLHFTKCLICLHDKGFAGHGALGQQFFPLAT